LRDIFCRKPWAAGLSVIHMLVVPVGWIPTLATLLSTGVGHSVTAMAVASRSHPIATESPPAAGDPARGDGIGRAMAAAA